MPLYEYRCPDNGQVVEVRHGMSERLETWGELCDRSGNPAGSTPASAVVERLLSVPVPTPSGGTGGKAGGAFQGCGSGCACAREA